jgi:hypothetical protein
MAGKGWSCARVCNCVLALSRRGGELMCEQDFGVRESRLAMLNSNAHSQSWCDVEAQNL